jgi:hypothetical protein
MTWPGWDSLDSVKQIASAVQVTTLIFWGLLVFFEIVAYFWGKAKHVFNVLALIAFALAVMGEGIQYKYDGRKEALHDAHDTALTEDFNKRLQASHDEAENARADAQHSADNAGHAEQQAAAAEQEAAKLKEQQGYRELTEDQKTRLIALLKPYAPQQLYFLSAPDAEATEYGDEISSALNAAGWKTIGPQYNWGTITHQGEGVWVQISDVSKPAPRGAALLQNALKTVGIEANGGSFPMLSLNSEVGRQFHEDSLSDLGSGREFRIQLRRS